MTRLRYTRRGWYLVIRWNAGYATPFGRFDDIRTLLFGPWPTARAALLVSRIGGTGSRAIERQHYALPHQRPAQTPAGG